MKKQNIYITTGIIVTLTIIIIILLFKTAPQPKGGNTFASDQTVEQNVGL